MRCPSCSHENREDQKFCVSCGSELALACPACGAPAEAGEHFCGKCGTSLTEDAPGLITRILEHMARTPLGPEGWSGAAVMPADTKADYESLIARIVREVANEGDVVIVAHGASIPLAGTSGLLRVLVTGSESARAERLAIEAGLDASEAKRAIAESDRQRRDYLRRFYDIPQELPTHYDLVVNTDTLAMPLAAQLVVSAAKG